MLVFHVCPDMWLLFYSWRHLNTRLHILLSCYRLDRTSFNMGFYNQHQSQGQMTVHQYEITRDVPQPPPPGHCFSNEHYVSGCFTGRRSIRQSWACNALAEMLSGRAAPAISRASVGPSGAERFKIERHVFNTRVGTNLSCQGAFNKPLPCSSRGALQRL